MLRNNKLKSIALEAWSVSWPMSLIMFFEFLIGIADVFVAGKFGKEIKAAYGLAFQMYFVFLVGSSAISVGSVSVISRLFTSNRKEEFKKAVTSSLVTAGVAGFIFSACGAVFGDDIIMRLNVPAEIKGYAATFMVIYSLGIFFDYIVMNTNGSLRACKMIKKSLVTMLIVAILNIWLNFALSFKTALGFKGIAVATAISLFVGCIMNMFHLSRYFLPRISGFSAEIVKKILAISWPSGLLHILWQAGTAVIFLILGKLPRYNVETMAAFTNGLRVEAAIFLPAFAFSMANAVIVGNLLGAYREKDAFLAGLTNCAIGVAIVTILSGLVMLKARDIVPVLSHERIVIDESVRYILISLIFEPIMAWGVILAGALNGSGDTRMVMMIVALSVWLVRIPLCYLLGIYFGFGIVAVWWSMNISILAQSIFITKRYFSRKWVVRMAV